MKTKLHNSILLCLCFLLGACTTPAVVQKADNETAEKAKTFHVKPNKSKLYFVNGELLNIFKPKHSYPSDLYINNELVGSMNKNNVLVFELIPGKYDIHWMPRSKDPIDQKSLPIKYKLDARSGQITILQGDYDLGGASYAGYIGSMISPPKTSLKLAAKDDIGEREVVLPQNCPASICGR